MRYDIVISGAGMSGMILAISLKSIGYSLVIIEKNEPRHDERTTAINHATKIFFDQYKIWNLIEEHAQPILDIFTTEGKSPLYLHYDYRDNGTEPMGYVIKNSIIKKALSSFNIQILSPTTYTNIINHETGVEITLQDNQKLTADLFICAEGKNSNIYELLNIKRISKPYNQMSIICNVEHLENHYSSAQERFYPSGPFALLPMKGDFYSSLVWTAKTNIAQQLMRLSRGKFIEEINQHCNLHITKVISEIQYYPLSINLSRRYYKHRVLLIGDVMQNIHPVAGQGLNLIVCNIAHLISVIQKYGIKQETLKRFTESRVVDNLLMAGFTDSIVRLFSNNNKTLKLIRNVGLGLVQKLPTLKNKLISRAMGKHTIIR